MNGPTHIIGGVALASATICYTGLYFPQLAVVPLVQTGLFLFGSSSSAILLDIDKKESTISRKHKFISFFLRLVLTHRGFTHSLLSYLIFSTAVLIGLLWIPNGFGMALALGLIIGYGSHLILDALNPLGIPLLYPINFRLSILKIETGSIMEYLFVSLLLISIIISWDNILESMLGFSIVEKMMGLIR